eukprot:g72815.t1
MYFLKRFGEQLRPTKATYQDPDEDIRRAFFWLLLWATVIVFGIWLLLEKTNIDNRATVSNSESFYDSDFTPDQIPEEQKAAYRARIKELLSKAGKRARDQNLEIWNLDCVCDNVVSYDDVYRHSPPSSSPPGRRRQAQAVGESLAERVKARQAALAGDHVVDSSRTGRPSSVRKQLQDWVSASTPLGATAANMDAACNAVASTLPKLSHAFGLFCAACTRSTVDSFTITQNVPLARVVNQQQFETVTREVWKKHCMQVMQSWRYQMEAMTSFWQTINFNSVLFDLSNRSGSNSTTPNSTSIKVGRGDSVPPDSDLHPTREWLYCFNSPNDASCENGEASLFMMNYLLVVGPEDCAAFWAPTNATDGPGSEGISYEDAYNNFLDTCAPEQCVYQMHQSLSEALFDWFAVMTSFQSWVMTAGIIVYSFVLARRVLTGDNDEPGDQLQPQSTHKGSQGASRGKDSEGLSPVSEPAEILDQRITQQPQQGNETELAPPTPSEARIIACCSSGLGPSFVWVHPCPYVTWTAYSKGPPPDAEACCNLTEMPRKLSHANCLIYLECTRGYLNFGGLSPLRMLGIESIPYTDGSSVLPGFNY